MSNSNNNQPINLLATKKAHKISDVLKSGNGLIVNTFGAASDFMEGFRPESKEIGSNTGKIANASLQKVLDFLTDSDDEKATIKSEEEEEKFLAQARALKAKTELAKSQAEFDAINADSDTDSDTNPK